MSAKKTAKRALSKVFVITKESAAKSQLETAILLWFNYNDPISILTLAHAANDCYNALGGHVGKPSLFQNWLKTKSIAFQKRTREVQNFIKHGRINLKGSVRYMPRLGEILIADSIECHEAVAGDATNLMALFDIRFALENPDRVREVNRLLFADGPEVEELRRKDRPTFLNESLKALRDAGF